MMESPASPGFGFTPIVNHSIDNHLLRSCAFINKFGDTSRTPPSLFGNGDSDECEEEDESEDKIDDLGGKTQVLVMDKECAQLSNLDGETQVVDHLYDGCETCVVNVEGETQVLDGYEGETQVDVDVDVDDDVYCQETQRMLLGGETEVQDDEECVRNVCSQFIKNGIDCDFTRTESGTVKDAFCDTMTSLVVENKLGHSRSKPLEQVCENFPATPPSSVEVDPGSYQRSFTSIRAASLRASGLAARCKALVETRNDSSRALIETENEISFVEHTPNSVRSRNMDKEEVKGDAGMGESVCSVVRKLCTEEAHDANRISSNEIDCEEGEAKTPPLHLVDYDDEVAGLSYVDSQEPGDLTQANALDFIERFVKDNARETQLNVCSEPLRRIISNHATCAKGFSNFSKKITTFRQPVDQHVSFNWDDEVEDEGGGDFFCRMKGKILSESGHKQRSLPQPQKTRRSGKLLEDKTDRVKFNDKSSAIQCDSKLKTFRDRKGSVLDTSEANVKKNMQMELNRELFTECAEEPTEDASCKGRFQEIYSVGPDTQMAAEAMEVLFCGEPASGNILNANHGNLAGVSNVTVSKSKFSGKVSEKKTFSDGLAIRKSKRNSNENKIVHKCGTTPTRSGESEVDGHHSLGNINPTNAEVCPSVLARRATRSMAVNQSNMLFNQADGPIRKDINSETNFQFGVVFPKGKRSRRYGRHHSALKDKSDGILCNAGEVQLSECVLHEASRPDVKTPAAEASSKRQFTSKHLSRQLVKSRDHGKMKTTKDSAKGILKLACNEGSAANRPVECSAMISCSLDAFNIDRDVSQKTVITHHSAKGTGAHIADCVMPVEMVSADSRTNKLARKRVKSAKSPCTTLNTNSVVDNARVGNSCRRQLPVNLSRSSLRKEISALLSNSPKSLSDLKRKRREMNEVRVLFSNHLDADVIKHQKKIVARLGVSLAFLVSDATHFVADSFVRTRNMLEAIALGKHIVTHLWLESCHQTNCLIDEKTYILRDAKKERELGFSMPDTLVHASQQPLLQNRSVIITPNSKPSKDIVATLVKAVHGQVIENFDEPLYKANKDNVLVLSCVEDYSACQSFLNQGVKVYNSELLLSGIVTQRLDYARHRLFEDHVMTAVSKRSRRARRM